MKPIHQKEGEFSPSSSSGTSYAVLKSPCITTPNGDLSSKHNSKGAYFQRTRPLNPEKLMENTMAEENLPYLTRKKIEEELNTLKLELERISNIINIDHVKLNQLNQKFMAHRDRADIHRKEDENANKQRT